MDSIRVARVDNVTLETFTPPADADGTPIKDRQKGTLHLTPHHLIFTSAAGPSINAQTGSGAGGQNGETWIPYPSITLLTRLPQTFGGVYPLQIRTRTFHSYVLGFDKAMEGGAEDVWLSVKDCAVAASVEQLYAFNYKLPSPASQIPYNPRTEFARQGVGSRSNAWRFTDINKAYEFCPTYPARMVVPKAINDSVLTYAGKYRSKGRIPALTYLHWANQASITRSSQPMVGLKNARSQQDERLIECIFTSHQYNEPQSGFTEHIYGATATNLIIDARPTTNAMANVAMGAGTENMDNYRLAKKAYLGIDNIHVMRNSLKMIAECISEAEQTGVMDRNKLRRSNWLKHISTVLEGSLGIIRNIHLNASHVLIHCSDGWDRTAQLSAVAQVCLDPFYRTFDGFKVLIEKDWVSFGHKFLDRCGHMSNEKLFTVDQPDDDSDEEGLGAQRAAQAFFASVQKQFNKSDHRLKEVSPVFAQFLECVWQIQRQFPERFEWNEQYLLDLHYHLYACQFGTFAFNSEKQRRVPEFDSGRDAIPYIDATVSAWEWFDLPAQREAHRNPTYEPKLDDKKSDDQGVLLFNPRDVRFWHRLFRRGDHEMNGRLQPIQNADFVTVAPGQTDPVTSAIQAPFAPASESPDPLSRSISGPDFATSPTPASSAAGPSKGWGWSQLSNGAISALQRGAKGVKTIGEGAYSHIRAELDAAEAGGEWGRPRQVSEREMSNDPWRAKTGQEATYASSSRQESYTPTQRPRRLDLDDPWSLPDPPPKSATTAATESIPGASDTKTAPTLAPPISHSSRSSSRQSSDPEPGDSLRHSLNDLTLLDQPKSTPPKSTQAAPNAAGRYEDKDKDVLDALGGDQKAWDPLGAM